MKVNYVKLFNNINHVVSTYAPDLAVGNHEHTHAFIEGLFKDETVLVNGYKIIYNCLFKQWQTSHPEIGVTEEFKILWDAIKYCEKG